MRKLWQKFLNWRNNPPPRKPYLPETRVKKVAASDEDMIREATANRGGGHTGGL